MKHLSEQQVQTLRKELLAKLTRLTDYHESVEEADPANQPDRVYSNEAGDDAVEDYDMLASDSFEEVSQEMIDEVKAALQRIEEGTYGVDEKTGEPIPFERLRLYPEARTAAVAKHAATE